MTRFRRDQHGAAAVEFAFLLPVLIVILLVVQIWLFSATLDAYLAGHRTVALPAAVVMPGAVCDRLLAVPWIPKPWSGLAVNVPVYDATTPTASDAALNVQVYVAGSDPVATR